MTRWDPFRDLTAIQDRMNRLFQETLSRQRGQEELETGQWGPAVDIFEKDDRILLRADLPGIDQSDIEIRVDDDTLLLRGDRKMPDDVKPEQYHRAERPHGPFLRSFSLPQSVDQSGIRATHKNGVLELTLPKRQETTARSIHVEIR